MDILNRWTRAIICSGETVRIAAEKGWADLSGAYLIGASLRGADLHGADLSGASVPVVTNLDRKMLAAVSVPGALDMGTWHACATTHCRAGWAITLAGKKGLELEDRVGPAVAGALIYAVSTGRKVPDFYATNEDAMTDMIACVALADATQVTK